MTDEISRQSPGLRRMVGELADEASLADNQFNDRLNILRRLRPLSRRVRELQQSYLRVHFLLYLLVLVLQVFDSLSDLCVFVLQFQQSV